MTERLYYDDPYLWTFDAKVTSCTPGTPKGSWTVTLDRSAFYPTSGGQPFDTGTLSFGNTTARVTDVTCEKGGEVLHITNREIPAGTEVHGEIDGERRTDHMEQHAGEHMLAGAVWELFRGTTIGLHLGAGDSTIDVTMPEGRTRLTAEEIILLEDMVNARIRQDAPIRCWFPEKEELEKLPLRKPPTVTEHVRIVAMGDFEMVACGGTHPSSTGRIGLIRILDAAPARGKLRLTFVCGGRACRLFRDYMTWAAKGSHVLSCPPDRIAGCANDLKARLAEAERNLTRLESEEILRVIREKEIPGDLPGTDLAVVILEDGNSKAASEAVSAYISEKGKALLLCQGERLTFARSGNVPIDMAELIRRVGRGGGRPELASGAGIPECANVARKILKTEGIR